MPQKIGPEQDDSLEQDLQRERREHALIEAEKLGWTSWRRSGCGASRGWTLTICQRKNSLASS